ncbi:MAG TPA: riboflavin synthase [Acidimicrobiia bacterium]|nr:riboflavin synthase [Acidimicrobiia bacterium]
MFTGIVERIGTVREITARAGAQRMVIGGAGLGELPVGASIAVNGVCLTVVESGDAISVDLIPETLERTNLGALSPDELVNLELPLAAGGRFDGHIVQGHIDSVGTIARVDIDNHHGTVMTVDVPEDLRRYVMEKGSVTIDGVSLTIAALTEDGFSVALIPHTLEVTTLGLRKRGDTVNLEMDVLAKYVERLLKVRE